MRQQLLNKFSEKLGILFLPLHIDTKENEKCCQIYEPFDNHCLHYINVWTSGKDNHNYLFLNLVESAVDFDCSLLPLQDINLWHLEESAGLKTMRGWAWSSGVNWFFFFTPEGKIHLCNVCSRNYSLCVPMKYLIPFLDMFQQLELDKIFIDKIKNYELLKNKDTQISLF